MRLLRWLTKLSAFRLAIWIGLATMLVHLFNVSLRQEQGAEVPILVDLEYLLLDAKFALRGPIQVSPEELRAKKVVVAAIDEKSIQRLGRFPWSRVYHAQLIDRVLADGAAAIAFDMTFADPSTADSLAEIRSVRDELRAVGAKVESPELEAVYADVERRASAQSPDEVMARSIRDGKSRVIVGHILYDDVDRERISPHALARARRALDRSKVGGVLRISPGRSGKFFHVPGRGAIKGLTPEPALDLIGDVTERFGYFNLLPDNDGKMRRTRLVMWAGDDLLVPSMDLLAVASAMGVQPGQINPISEDEDRPVLGKIRIESAERTLEIPVDATGMMLLNFHGPEPAFQRISIADILDDVVAPGTFRDRVVLVGATAIGTFDQRVTPFNDFAPGVELHATAVANMLQEDFLQRPVWAIFFEVLLLLLFSLGLGYLFARVEARISLVAYLLAAVGYGALDYALFRSGYVVVSALPQLQLLATFIGTTTFRYFTETREKQQLRSAFQFYLDEAVIKEVLQEPENLKLGGKKAEVSIIFSDIRGFTTMSERLPPEELGKLLNEYLTPMTGIVFQHGGTLDKYIGDAVMCFFGAPMPQPDHAIRACRCALAMMEALQPLRKRWREEGKPDIDIGIGINSGIVSVGNFGSAMRFDYTVMGDSVNLASRLEGTNKEYGTNVIVSQFVHERVKDQIAVRELGAVRVKGKRLPVKIFELLAIGPLPAEQRPFVETFTRALGLRFPEHKFAEAAAEFRKALELRPGDFTTRRYLDECEKLAMSAPPEAWDGVYEMKTK